MDNIRQKEKNLINNNPNRDSAFKPRKNSLSSEVSISKELENKMGIKDESLGASWEIEKPTQKQTYNLSESLQKMLDLRLSNSLNLERNDSAFTKKSIFLPQKVNVMEYSQENKNQVRQNTLYYIPFGVPANLEIFPNYTPIKKIGPLTVEERAEKVKRYLEKKKNRKWRSVRYKIRKTLAEQRERVHGRFVKVPKTTFPTVERSEYLLPDTNIEIENS